jgi:enterobactin synthetase component D
MHFQRVKNLAQHNLNFIDISELITLADCEVAGQNRASQSIAGREAAKIALSLIGLDKQTYIATAQSGEPLWPAGVCGSITHSPSHAFAAVSKSLRSIGIDAEEVSRRCNVEKLFKRILTPAEYEDPSFESSPAHALKIFTAKEATYKTLFPLVRRWFGFKAAEIRFQQNGDLFHVVLTEPLNSEFIEGTMLFGKHLISQHHIIAVVGVLA